MAQWGDSYSDYAFHTFFLDCGPSDFTSLKERLLETTPDASLYTHRQINDAHERVVFPIPRKNWFKLRKAFSRISCSWGV